MKTKHLLLISLCALLVLFLSSCAPLLRIENETTLGVKALVSIPGSMRQLVTVEPMNDAGLDTIGIGKYIVVVIPDKDWLEYARLQARVLNDLLTGSPNLSPQQANDIKTKLKEIHTALEQYEKAKSGAACSGKLDSEGFNLATISQDASGNLAISCK